MRKIWVYALFGFGLVGAAAIGTMIALYFTSDEIVEVEPKKFPKEFLFGASSSSYQVEGAWNETTGRSATIWDTLVHDRPDLIQGGANGDVAADSYNYFKEDVKALKETGFHFYRFSISWARILPDGAQTNQAGVDYYNSLIDELIANDIEPMITMYHWDLPQYIQDLGGWTNEVVVDYFDHYSDVLYKEFGNKTKKWITFNEPYEFCHNGYGTGIHAPLIQSPGVGEYECGHNVLLAHAKAYHNYKDNYEEYQEGEVGISLNSFYFYPAEDLSENSTLPVSTLHHMLGWFANPIFSATGNYPSVMIDHIQKNSEEEGRPWSRLPEFTSEEIASIRGSADFLALNYYTSRIVKPKTNFPEEYGWEDDAGVDLLVDPSWKKGKSDFLYSVPEGLYDLLNWIKAFYDNPHVYITENGFSDDGQLNDDDRVTYLKEHLWSVNKAWTAGCHIEAYAVWSIIDNFEWLAGYEERFGIYSVNFESETKERIAKKSSEYLSKVIKTREIEHE